MPAPSAPSSFAVAEAAILHFYKSKVSNKAAVRLTWTNNAPGVAQHRIEKSTDSGATWLLAAIADVDAAELVVGDLALSTAHQFQIRAEADGASSWVGPLSHTTDALATSGAHLTAPSSFAVGSITSFGATFTFEDNSAREAYHEIEISRVGSGPAIVLVPGAIETVTCDFVQLFGTFPAVAGQTFKARCRAVGGKGTAAAFPAFQSAWSSELIFQLLAPAIRITFKTPVYIEQNVAQSMQFTSIPPGNAFSVTSGTLPTGLSIHATTGVISGTPTTVGTFNATIQAGDGLTTATLATKWFVQQSLIVIGGAAQQTVPLGADYLYTFLARHQVPSAPQPNTWSAVNLPDWLTQTGGIIEGTPTVPGIYVFQLSATNGSSTGYLVVTLTVPAVSVTTPADIYAFVGQALDLQLTASAVGGEWSITDGPGWLTLTNDRLGGTPLVVGDVTVDVTATLGEEGDSKTLTIHVLSLFQAPDEIEAWVGDFVFQQIRYRGAGVFLGYVLSNAPAGLAIEHHELVSTPYAVAEHDAIEGTVTAAGIFEARLFARVATAFDPLLVVEAFSAPIGCRISGGLFLSWFHDDPSRRELQVMMRTGEVLAYQGPVVLKRGNAIKLYIIFRDGPLGTGNYGRNLYAGTAPTEVRLTVRPTGNLDGNPLLSVGGAVVSESIDGHTVYSLTFDITREPLESAFTRINSAPGAETTSLRLEGIGELSWIISGNPDSSRHFTVLLEQDVDR